MESVLHIESLDQHVPGPLAVGSEDYFAYGTHTEEDYLGDVVKNDAVYTKIGSPLTTPDLGRHSTAVPLYKTFGFSPDIKSSGSLTFNETIHYLKDRKYLIPLRTKIRSGRSEGVTLSHLPSLNFVRKDMVGFDPGTSDPRSHIANTLLENDSDLVAMKRHPAHEWVRDELSYHLDLQPAVETEFGTTNLSHQIEGFHGLLMFASWDPQVHQYREILDCLASDQKFQPASFRSKDVVHRPLGRVFDNLVPHYYNFRPVGKINHDNLPRIDQNSNKYRMVADLMDRLMFTDLNMDVIIDRHGKVHFEHYHVAENRFAVCSTAMSNEMCAVHAKSMITGKILRDMVFHVANYHSHMTPDIFEILVTYPVKIKLIKTICDEVMILFYRHNSTSVEEPLCGIHLNLALESLAPFDLVPSTI